MSDQNHFREQQFTDKMAKMDKTDPLGRVGKKGDAYLADTALNRAGTVDHEGKRVLDRGRDQVQQNASASKEDFTLENKKVCALD